MITSTLSCLGCQRPIRGGRSSAPSLNRLRAWPEDQSSTTPPSTNYGARMPHLPLLVNLTMSQSDPKGGPEDEYDEDPEEDPVDYSADGGDDGDDEDEPSEEDKDDDVDMEADGDEEEEHPSPADSIVVALQAIDQAPSAKETEPSN
ncbi:hypothetical protein Tco_0319132 [Tanacetum coccineum]